MPLADPACLPTPPTTAQITPSGLIFSKDVKDLSVLKEDDELAAREVRVTICGRTMEDIDSICEVRMACGHTEDTRLDSSCVPHALPTQLSAPPPAAPIPPTGRGSGRRAGLLLGPLPARTGRQRPVRKVRRPGDHDAEVNECRE
jgi:hypothetical protein